MLPPLVSRFIAGKTPADVIDYAENQLDEDITPLINRLGEHYTEPDDVRVVVEEYEHLINELTERNIDAAISLKPSQLGLDISEELFHENATRLVADASAAGVFVWFDMEDYTTTDSTIALYKEVVQWHPDSVGICIQANLKRTQSDLAELMKTEGRIRLVKGAYSEPPEIALTNREDIDDAYVEYLELLFSTHNGTIAVGSHDSGMVSQAAVFHAMYGTEYEIQMLKGVQEDEQRRLAREQPVAQYIPYGPEWKSYVYRRLLERKNVGFILRAILSG